MSPRDAALWSARVAVGVGGVDVGVEHLDQVFHGGEHAGRRVAVRVGGEALGVALAGRGEDRRDARSADRHRRQAGDVGHLALAVGRPRPVSRSHRRDVGIGAASDEQLHRVDVARVGGAPERRRAGFVRAEQVEVVLRVPELLLQPGVRVRALVEQLLHQVEIRVALLIGGARLRVERLGRPLGVDRRVEWRRAGVARQVRVRAVLEQIGRDVELAVHRRDEQRRRVIARARLVDVGAVGDERLDGGHRALPRREMERRQAAGASDQLAVGVGARQAGDFDLLRARLRVHALAADAARRLFLVLLALRRCHRRLVAGRRERRVVDDAGRGLDARAARDEQLDDVDAVERRGKHERRLVVGGVARVHPGTVIEERLHRVDAAGGGRQHERGDAGRGRRVHRRASCDERLDDGRRSVLAGEVQRHEAAEPRRGRDAGARCEERARERGVAVGRRPVERGHPVALGLVDVGARLHEGADGVGVLAHRRVGDLGRAGRGVNERGQQNRAGDAGQRAVNESSLNHVTLSRCGWRRRRHPGRRRPCCRRTTPSRRRAAAATRASRSPSASRRALSGAGCP